MSGERMRVAVAGAGGMGREALAWLRDARPDVEAVAFFVADRREYPVGADLDLPVLTSIAELSGLGVGQVLLAIGDNDRRRVVAEQVDEAGIARLSIVHPTALLGPGVSLASGCLVAPGAILTRDIELGQGVIVNYGARAGHDCGIGDFSFVGPGAILTGGIEVGHGVLIGAGAVVLPSRRIGEGARVGAGAVVAADVRPGATVVGVPAHTRHG